MAGPSGQFTPWLAHSVVENRCRDCGLHIPTEAIIATLPMIAPRAYSHAGAFLTVTPTGTIVACQPKET